MATSVTIAAPGQIKGAGDKLALFLKVFAGEILTAFNQKSVTAGRHVERTISNGKSAQFPGFGRAAAAYLAAGGSLDDIRTNIKQFEKTIVIDGLLTSDCLIFDLDEAMAHYDFRQEYSRQMGEALAKANDGAVLAEIAKMVVANEANLDELGKGIITTGTVPAAQYGETEAMGLEIFKQLLKIKTKLSENSVPTDERYVYIRPMALNALIAHKDIINKLYGASMTIEDNAPPKLLGFTLIETPFLTDGGAPVNGGVVQGSGHVFPSTYKNTCMFLVAHRSAVGTLTLRGLKMDSARRIELQADEIVASYAKGYGGLRPEAACMGVVTQGS